MILADPRNPTARALHEALAVHLREDEVPPGVIVVLGGDGYLLEVIHREGTGPTYVGLNAGRVGFLLNDAPDLAAAAHAVRTSRLTVVSFPMLVAELRGADGSVRTATAVNDIVLERSTGQTAHLALRIDDRPVVERLVCDGVVFSTALGSTAYTFSAGGPACHPTLPLLAVTPLCPHRPKLQPFLLHERATAEADAIDTHRRPVRVVADGVTIDGVVGVTVRTGPSRVRLGWLSEPDFTTRMVAKILTP